MPGVSASLLGAVVVSLQGDGSFGTQLSALGCTLGIAIVGGVAVGKLMKLLEVQARIQFARCCEFRKATNGPS